MIDLKAMLFYIAQVINGQKRGFLQHFKTSSSTHQTTILSAAIANLGKIGTPQSAAFLKKLAGSKTALAEAGRKAIQSIPPHYARLQQAGTSANS